MTDEEYVFHETSRERKRNGYGDFNKKRQGGKHVRLSSDNLTRKEWEKMNGEVLTFELDQPRSWEEYKEIPEHLKAEYLQYLWAKYDATPKMIADMFSCSRQTVMNEQRRLGLVCPSKRGHSPTTVMNKWEDFVCKGIKKEEPVESPVEQEIQQTVTSLRTLLESFVGKGARVTIEITL